MEEIPNQNDQAKDMLLSAQSVLSDLEKKIEDRLRNEGERTDWIDAWRNIYGNVSTALTTIKILKQDVIDIAFLNEVIEWDAKIIELLKASSPGDRTNEIIAKHIAALIKEKIDAEIIRIAH